MMPWMLLTRFVPIRPYYSTTRLIILSLDWLHLNDFFGGEGHATTLSTLPSAMHYRMFNAKYHAALPFSGYGTLKLFLTRPTISWSLQHELFHGYQLHQFILIQLHTKRTCFVKASSLQRFNPIHAIHNGVCRTK